MKNWDPYIAALQPIISRVRTDRTAVKINRNMVWTRASLSNSLMAKHFEGEAPRGICPIQEGGNTVKVALLDLDSHNDETSQPEMFKVALEVSNHLNDFYGLLAIPFRSSGGKGIHLYILWNDDQDAYSVRYILEGALKEVGYRNGTGGVAKKQIEIFPKQPEVQIGRCGSQFILPLAGLSEPIDLVAGEGLGREALLSVKWDISSPIPFQQRVLPTPRPFDPSTMTLELARAAKFAMSLDPDIGYDDWLKVGMALHHTCNGREEGLEVWDNWSAKGFKYNGSDELRAKWDTFNSNSKSVVTLGTLRMMARTAGYVDEYPNSIDESGKANKIENLTTDRFKLIHAAEFAKNIAVKWLVKKILPATGIAMIFGKSGSGKSFFALDIIASIARGESWCGHKVKQGSVVYVAAEGAIGFRNRLVAYAEYHDVDLEELPIYIIDETPNLSTNDDEALIKSIREIDEVSVVAIDTLAQAIAGANENSGEDMGPILARCKRINQMTGALVILVHHTGKDETRGARGWSGMKAAMDTEIEISLSGNDGMATITKQKDGETGASFVFKLERVFLGLDEDGEDITSCILDILPNFGPKQPKPIGKWQSIVLEIVKNLSCLDDVFPSVNDVLERAVEKVIFDPGSSEKKKRDSRRDSALRGLNSLVENNLIFVQDDRVMLPQLRKEPQSEDCGIFTKSERLSQIPHNPMGVRNCGADVVSSSETEFDVDGLKAAV